MFVLLLFDFRKVFIWRDCEVTELKTLICPEFSIRMMKYHMVHGGLSTTYESQKNASSIVSLQYIISKKNNFKL